MPYFPRRSPLRFAILVAIGFGSSIPAPAAEAEPREVEIQCLPLAIPIDESGAWCFGVARAPEPSRCPAAAWRAATMRAVPWVGALAGFLLAASAVKRRGLD